MTAAWKAVLTVLLVPAWAVLKVAWTVAPDTSKQSKNNLKSNSHTISINDSCTVVTVG